MILMIVLAPGLRAVCSLELEEVFRRCATLHYRYVLANSILCDTDLILIQEILPIKYETLAIGLYSVT